MEIKPTTVTVNQCLLDGKRLSRAQLEQLSYVGPNVWLAEMIKSHDSWMPVGRFPAEWLYRACSNKKKITGRDYELPDLRRCGSSYEITGILLYSVSESALYISYTDYMENIDISDLDCEVGSLDSKITQIETNGNEPVIRNLSLVQELFFSKSQLDEYAKIHDINGWNIDQQRGYFELQAYKKQKNLTTLVRRKKKHEGASTPNTIDAFWNDHKVLPANEWECTTLIVDLGQYKISEKSVEQSINYLLDNFFIMKQEELEVKRNALEGLRQSQDICFSALRKAPMLFC